nr:hypothetical protein BaRGS_007991 [Batillaria attramentaria]
MSSTTYQNGTFYLDVSNPVVSGLYSCEINPMDPALDCVARSSDLKVGDSVILNATDIQLKLKNRKMSDCKEVQRRFPRSGVYTLTVGPEHFPVYCDQTTDGGGWTVIQRRQDGSVNFDRTWQEYKDGFGHLTGEFWLGLDEMHWLTSSKNCSLRIDLTDFHGNTAYAEYDSVSIHGPEDGYRLVVSGYSGTAGDGLMKPVRGATQKWHIANNQSFSTPDHDRDSCRCNCAADRGAGWWYYVCAQVNLNARYTHKEIIDVDRLVWYPWKNSKTLKAADMKIRPKE